MSKRRPTALLAAVAVFAAAALSACGSAQIDLGPDRQSANVQQGAQLFSQRCSGCHTLDSAGAEGSAYTIGDRERVDGPNFNTRCESRDNVLYAIRNGGYSGAIMPENIVVGDEADKVADFLAQYAGAKAKAGCPKASG